MGIEPSVKKAIAGYWDENPCGAFASDEAPGQPQFYRDVATYRYTTQPFMQSLIGFDSFPGGRVLEVGCGLGTDLLQFARGGADVVGVDLSSQSLSLADRHFRVYDLPGNFLRSDAENMPFPDSAFDVVYSFGVLHHVPDTQRAIDECYRVLKPGGRLILMLYNSRSWHLLVEPYLLVVMRLVLGKTVPPGFTSPSEVVRRYDGATNPLGKAYSKTEVRQMLRSFERVRLRVRSARFRGRSWWGRIYARLLDWTGINRMWGFWIVAHTQRPAGGDSSP